MRTQIQGTHFVFDQFSPFSQVAARTHCLSAAALSACTADASMAASLWCVTIASLQNEDPIVRMTSISKNHYSLHHLRCAHNFLSEEERQGRKFDIEISFFKYRYRQQFSQ